MRSSLEDITEPEKQTFFMYSGLQTLTAPIFAGTSSPETLQQMDVIFSRLRVANSVVGMDTSLVGIMYVVAPKLIGK